VDDQSDPFSSFLAPRSAPGVVMIPMGPVEPSSSLPDDVSAPKNAFDDRGLTLKLE
jgi:hypothetical protein